MHDPLIHCFSKKRKKEEGIDKIYMFNCLKSYKGRKRANTTNCSKELSMSTLRP